MSLLKKLVVPAIALASSFHVHAQIKNAQTITAKVSGNCGMCETTIEKAGSLAKEAKVDWDKDKQVATITYDAQKTDPDAVLKRIALAGYDNEKFLAPEEAYSKLHGCCQYERIEAATGKSVTNNDSAHSGHASAADQGSTASSNAQANDFSTVLQSYFKLQEALVKSDAKNASAAAGALQKAMGGVNMVALSGEGHNAWMQVKDKLAIDAKAIAGASDLQKQRALFAALSQNMYTLAKAADLPQPVYYNNCPMFNDGKGANWLSEDKTITNPYYGAQMLSCGKTVETLK